MTRAVLVGGTLLDTSPPTPQPVARTIVIEDGRISEWLEPGTDTDGEVINAAGLWAIPGLVDAHYAPFQHHTVRDEPPHVQSVAQNLLQELRPLGRWLEGGATSLCSAGAHHNLDIDLRDALGAGTVRGPRVFAAGCPIGAYSGGRLQNAGLLVEVSGVDQARRAARQQIKGTADLLVLCVDAHEWPSLDAPMVALDESEIRAMVGEAQHARVPVYALCASTAAIRSAVRAGVDAVVATNGLDETAMQILHDSETALVAALTGSPGASTPRPAETSGSAKAVAQAMHAGIDTLVCSAACCEHWCLAEEGRSLVHAGVGPYQILQAATIQPARSLGWDYEIGSLQPGCIADTVLLDGNPVDDIAYLARVRAVLQAGRVVYWRKEVGERDRNS